ncbi:uncharacterized protein [Periplaneta americana]|uniref:uncharacterized protein isoform X6 n=1 Tax=Periplaneta americana TaxID=6978 RepID=UPI0037E7502F
MFTFEAQSPVTVAMDVIKMEPVVDPLALQIWKSTDLQEDNNLSEEGNTLDLHVNGIKEECLDRSCDLSSKLKVDETRKPICFSLVKYENEQEENLLDLHETGINREIMDHSCDLTSEIKVDKNPVPFYLWEKCEVKKEDEVEYSSFADIEDAWNFEINSFNIKEEVSIDEHEVGMQSIPLKELKVEAEHPRLVIHREMYNAAWVSTSGRGRRSDRNPVPELEPNEFIHPPRAYEGLLPISEEKFNDLQELKKFCSAEAQAYYISLPHISK